MKRYDVLIIRAFVVYTILEPLWMGVCSAFIHFFGASSLIYLFQLSLGNGKGAVSYLSLITMSVLLIGMVVSFIIVEYKKRIEPFLFVVVVDLIISLGIIVYKLMIHNYLDILLASIGWIVRLLIFLYLFHLRTQTNY